MATRKKAPAKKTPAKKAPRKKAPVRKAPTKKAPTRKATAAPKRAAKAPARRARKDLLAPHEIPALSKADLEFMRQLRADPGARKQYASEVLQVVPEIRARGGQMKNLDTPRAQSKMLKRAGSLSPWVLIIVGGSIWWLSSRAKAASAPQLPPPAPPPQPPPATISPQPPAAPVLTDAQRIKIEFRRVKPSERIPRDILTLAQDHKSKPIGAIIFQTSAIDGKQYAYVLEQHANTAPGDGGVSVYVKR